MEGLHGNSELEGRSRHLLRKFNNFQFYLRCNPCFKSFQASRSCYFERNEGGLACMPQQ